MAYKVFPDGIFLKEPSSKAPDFVLGGLSFSVDKAIAWLEQNKNEAGYVNLKLLKGRSGKYYAELDTWQPSKEYPSKEKAEEPKTETDTINPDDIPF